MINKREKLIQLWVKWAAPALLVLFCGVSILLAFLQHAAYQTSLYDLGYYTQVLWNLSHGRGFITSLGPGNYLTNHFSVMLLILAPLFALWSDPRVLMVVQPIALALTVVPGYLILHRRYPRIAPAFVAVFVFSPLLHQAAAAEFHGVILAAPLLAWAFYALYMERMRMMFIALGLSLLVREDVGLYVASFGLILLLCRRGRRLLGLGLTFVGGAWFVLMVVWIMPSFGMAYHHFYAFPTLGSSVPEIISSVLHDPLRLLSLILTRSKINAVIGFIAPLAGLPILAAGYVLLWLPMMVLYLISTRSNTGLLNSYSLAPFLPLVWGSIAVVLARSQLRQTVVGLGSLALATLIGFIMLSPFPGGAEFDPSRYQITPRAGLAEQIVASIPADASVVTQSLLGAHLATRSRLKLFSGYTDIKTNLPDYILLDANTRQTYQMTLDAFKAALSDIEIDPLYDIVREQDGFFVFKKPMLGQASVQRTISVTWSSTLRLYGADLAQANSSSPFTPIVDQINAGSQLRVMLYWTALLPMPEHLSISVQVVDSSGALLAQDDNWPAHGAVPAPLWGVGRSIRDIHYLDLSSISLPSQVRLIVKVYYSGSLELLMPVEGYTLAALKTR